MKFLYLVLIVLFVSCSTTGHFKVPADSQLYVEGKPLQPHELQAGYKRSPFFWNVSSGIPYRIEKNGKLIDEGKIQSRFRVVSIFWPPFAIIYWPMGFKGDETYDFTSKADAKIRPDSNYVSVPHRK